MKKHLTFAAVARLGLPVLTLLLAAPAAAQQVHPLDARNYLLDQIFDSDDEEIVELWIGFREEERIVASAARWLLNDPDIDVSLDPPAAAIARNDLLEMVGDLDDAALVELYGHFKAAERAGLGLVTQAQTDDKGRKKRDDCLDHLPTRITIPAGPLGGVTVPTGGVMKAWCHQAPLRCRVGKRIIRHQIKKNTGHKCKFG
ncbi:MAG: hypothetical protein F4Y16_05115 [Holophagales bacterium]|nr:hypothetical protein [Holophagales bacterium]MYH26709.1 hypothetical protein [Holophagales bacterium]